MTPYPHILGELETLDQVLSGRSLARFGDTELALVEGLETASQPFHADLSKRLAEILHGNAGECLVGIPNLLAPIERANFWDGYQERFGQHLAPNAAYASSFVSRPDIVPWVDVPGYWDGLESIWKDQHVTLVRGGDPVPQLRNPSKLTGHVSLFASDMTSAQSVTEIVGPSFDAWSQYPEILQKIRGSNRVLICLGATATVMAVDLCAQGVHAIDLGHIGLYLRRHREGLPMKRNKLMRKNVA